MHRKRLEFVVPNPPLRSEFGGGAIEERRFELRRELWRKATEEALLREVPRGWDVWAWEFRTGPEVEADEQTGRVRAVLRTVAAVTIVHV